MAATSGDGGVDATLYVPTDDPDVACQFSLRRDWETKVKQTCERLQATSPETRLLIFMTNLEIGPAARDLARTCRQRWDIYLDVRDREWFLANRNRDAMCEAEAEEFCEFAADPYIGSDSSIDRQGQALDDLEAKAAFVYLGLQWEDDARDKGLTRLSFEAIVRAVLRDTTSEQRMPRAQIHKAVEEILPAHPIAVLTAEVDSALAKLTKVHVRHWTKQDEFCLTWDERTRLRDRLAEFQIMDVELNNQLDLMLSRIVENEPSSEPRVSRSEVVGRCRSVLERVLLSRGATFAEAVVQEQGASVRFEDIEALVFADLSSRPPTHSEDVDPRLIISIVQSLLVEPPDSVRAYLRNLSDTYTLFAFLRETPDVQAAVVKMFSDGDIWLDTNVVLPLLGETLLADDDRSHTILLSAAREAGLDLYVTGGVLQELATHVAKCQAYARSSLQNGALYGQEPFLLGCYRLSGRPISGFDSWLENFCGTSRPEDDIADYLNEFHGISRGSLEEYAELASPLLRAMVAEVWQERRDERDKRLAAHGGQPLDLTTRTLLVNHDVENYLGAVMRRERRNERTSTFGYKTWWLTLDSTALRMSRELVDRLDERPPSSPAISPDFMIHYLSVGPVRARLSRSTEEVLPLMMNMSILDAVPAELIELSDALRRELVSLPPHVVRRKIRDTLDEARVLLGTRAKAGESGLTAEIKARLIRQATNV
ncbi:hypothetical protein [Leifsonia sp. 1010]|uniref:hypothetical protein n=1 Tax=Leifsonia sp. 1010 TaxID=2817769 RepID=UPI00286ADB22|nr:hypothetical protein [Leifsonia sp. 1010]